MQALPRQHSAGAFMCDRRDIFRTFYLGGLIVDIGPTYQGHPQNHQTGGFLHITSMGNVIQGRAGPPVTLRCLLFHTRGCRSGRLATRRRAPQPRTTRTRDNGPLYKPGIAGVGAHAARAFSRRDQAALQTMGAGRLAPLPGLLWRPTNYSDRDTTDGRVDHRRTCLRCLAHAHLPRRGQTAALVSAAKLRIWPRGAPPAPPTAFHPAYHDDLAPDAPGIQAPLTPRLRARRDYHHPTGTYRRAFRAPYISAPPLAA